MALVPQPVPVHGAGHGNERRAEEHEAGATRPETGQDEESAVEQQETDRNDGQYAVGSSGSSAYSELVHQVVQPMVR